MASGKLEQALNTMKVGGTEEYLKSSLTVLKIMQNIMVHPDTEKFKKIRLAATVSLGRHSPRIIVECIK